MKKIISIFVFLITIQMFSQEKIISGSITNETGDPLIGASIFIKGASKGAMTDFDGNYNLKAKVGDVLLFSYIGSTSKEVKIGKKNRIDITLTSKNTELEEVVIVGYGSVKKSDLTGSVSSVKGEELAEIGSIGFDEALAGKAAGVVVTQNSGAPGGGASIRIRGISSLNGSEPLYVIDGIPMDNTSESGLGSQDLESAQLSPLALINPADIESVEILKDASSTAIYGSRGANGVILITTKQGKSGKGQISVNHEFGITEIINFIDLLDGNDYIILKEEAYRNNGNLNPLNIAQYQNALNRAIKSTDWQKSILNMGKQSSTGITFSGGDKNLKYLLSTNYLDSEGLIQDTDYTRVSTRLNLKANLSSKFSVASTLNYTHATSNQKAINTSNNDIRGATNAIMRALRASPTTGLLADDDDDGFDGYSPTTALEANQYSNLVTQFIGSLSLEYKFNKALSVKTAFSFQNKNTAQRYYQLDRLPDNKAEGGRAKTGDSRATRSTITNTLNYRKRYGRNNISVILGQSLESSENEKISLSNFGFANDLLTYYAPGTATFQDPDNVSYLKTTLSSLFGRINYTLNKKYLFTLTGRYDGSSKFAAGNKWAFFPAAAFAYKLSEENFMQDIEAISEAKLRISYGTSGNQAISAYQSLNQFSSDLTGFNEESATIYYANQLPNPDLTWETTTQLDTGIDLSFLKNKYSASFGYYQKTTNDLLFRGNKIPAHSGQSTYTENYGSMLTKGFEASFKTHILQSKNFSWSVNGNIATGKTIIKDMASDYLFSGMDTGVIPGGTQRLIVGKEIGTFWGYERAGIAQFDDFVEFQGLSNQEQINKYNANPSANYTFVDGFDRGVTFENTEQKPGEQLYKDNTGDGVLTDDDRTDIGNAQPDFTFGIKNTFKIGNLDFNFFIDGRSGNQIAAMQNQSLLNFQGRQQALAITMNRWTPENPSNVWPRMDWDTNSPFSDRHIEDGSFIRLRSASAGYNFPKKVVTKMNVSNLRLFATVSNIHTWSNYTGFNPDVSIRAGNTTGLGHDRATYPAARVYRLGATLKF